jgi:hypothetical protein
VRRLVFAAALVLLTAGCAPETPDYQSIWTTSVTSTTPTSTVEAVPFSDYLDSIGVGKQLVAPGTLPGLTVSIPTPRGWAKRTGSAIPPTAEVITKEGAYPNALLMVYQLNGDLDPREVIKHASGDVALSANFKQLDASGADFHGFPSSMIQYSYDLDGKRLHSFSRSVIPTGSPPDRQRYLVQLTVTSLAQQAVAESSDIEEIINGFTVADK